MGGVAIYLRRHLTYKPRTDLDVFEESVFESIFVEVNDKGGSYIVGVIYRPPDSNMTLFFQHLETVVDKVKNKRCYLMGDFNLDLIKSEHHSATGKFLSDMNSVGFHPLISLPSRITPSSATLIDNIFTNDFCRPISSGMVFSAISDHLPAFAIFGRSGVGQEMGPRYVIKRENGLRNKEKFREWVSKWGKGFSLRVNQ